jgi:hypothetical protein
VDLVTSKLTGEFFPLQGIHYVRIGDTITAHVPVTTPEKSYILTREFKVTRDGYVIGINVRGLHPNIEITGLVYEN